MTQVCAIGPSKHSYETQKKKNERSRLTLYITRPFVYKDGKAG